MKSRDSGVQLKKKTWQAPTHLALGLDHIPALLHCAFPAVHEDICILHELIIHL